MKHIKIIIAILAGIVIIFLLAKGGYKKMGNEIENSSTNQSSILEIKPNDWVIGTSSAKVTIIEYLDFECEACAAYYPLITQLKKEYKDSIRFVIRYFPLQAHRNSKTAAYAAEAAGKQGKFWEMYDILFSKQSIWGKSQVTNQDQFDKYALEAGVNIEQWRKDVKTDEIKNRVNDGYKEATNLNLEGTPSFFLNGKKIRNPGGYDAFKKLIDEALKINN